MTTIANDKLRKMMRQQPSGFRRFFRRVNPALIAGALLAGAVLFHIGTSATGAAIECRPTVKS